MELRERERGVEARTSRSSTTLGWLRSRCKWISPDEAATADEPTSAGLQAGRQGVRV